MRILAAPALLVVFLAPACGSSPSSSSPPATTPPCSAALGSSSGFELTVVGTGACATTLRLGLRVATGSPTAPTWTAASASPLEVQGAWKETGGAFTRPVTVVNKSSQPVTLIGLEWSTDAGGVGLAVDRLLHDGYQSWSYTGMESIPASMPSSAGTAPHGGDDENVLGELPGVSWWWTALADASSNGLVAGADGGTVLKTYVAADGAGPVRLRIVQGVTGDAVVLQPGQSRALDGLYLALGDVRTNLDAYAHAVAAKHPAASPRQPALRGWGSWNEYYAMITSSDLSQEATWAAATLKPLGLTDFLLDDGYETHWGSWTAAPAFGATLPAVTSAEQAQGLKPAIWIAPFYVDTRDALITAHADWFVHDARGALRTYDNLGPTSAALDVTSPGARDFVTQTLQGLYGAGFHTLKIDFLFGGAIEGVRQQTLTSLESYAQWMKVVRDAVPSAHLVGCGAPMLPSVGWVDSMRIGSDIAFATHPTPYPPFLMAEARQVAMRAMTDAWWSLDPDVLLLRGTGITDAEAWSVAVYSALAGGNYLLGDGRQASDLRRAFALSPDLVALAAGGAAARPEDLTAATDGAILESPVLAGKTVTAVPHVWRRSTASGAHGAVAVFAWDTDGYQAAVSLPEGAVELVAPTSTGPTTRKPAGGDQTVTVAQYDARLFTW